MAAGRVTAIDVTHSTLTIDLARGAGWHGWRGKQRAGLPTSVTVDVPATAVVRRQGVTVTLSALVVRDTVVVRGVRVGTVTTTQRVTVVPAHKHGAWSGCAPTPTATPTPTPTTPVTPTPTATATPTAPPAT